MIRLVATFSPTGLVPAIEVHGLLWNAILFLYFVHPRRTPLLSSGLAGPKDLHNLVPGRVVHEDPGQRHPFRHSPARSGNNAAELPFVSALQLWHALARSGNSVAEILGTPCFSTSVPALPCPLR